MFKSVLIIIFVILILLIIRTIMQRLKKEPKNTPISSKDTIQCTVCKVYTSRDEAILKGDNAFCCQQHLDDWNKST